MSEQAWTAEPWHVCSPGIVFRADGSDIGQFENETNGDRAVACVNAMQGITDPAELRRKLSNLARWTRAPEYHPADHGDLATVYGAFVDEILALLPTPQPAEPDNGGA